MSLRSAFWKKVRRKNQRINVTVIDYEKMNTKQIKFLFSFLFTNNRQKNKSFFTLRYHKTLQVLLQDFTMYNNKETAENEEVITYHQDFLVFISMKLYFEGSVVRISMIFILFQFDTEFSVDDIVKTFTFVTRNCICFFGAGEACLIKHGFVHAKEGEVSFIFDNISVIIFNGKADMEDLAVVVNISIVSITSPFT